MSAKAMGAIYGQGFNPSRQAIILAGCDSPHLAAAAAADEMLARTRRRIAISVPDQLTLVVTAESEASEPSTQSRGASSPFARNIVAQPSNRGTAPAILLALMRIANQAPANAVAIFPSDHDLTDDRVFMRHVNFAFSAVEARPELSVILGMAALGPECSYGWIEPGPQLSASDPVRAVRRFVGHAEHRDAIDMMRRGALWNSFVTVARVSTLLSLIMLAEPELYSAFASIRSAFGTRSETSAVERLYGDIGHVDFSSGVLAGCPVNLAVLPVNGVAFRSVLASTATVVPARPPLATAVA
ncbi:MAG: sugar phosphate nucleotidyltransferase [Candidatus Binatus sp.]|uniref:sugar phosphate nucleotidyltransferase n=1 Tax=Candidatus Binatus sp. TaxID=2811406 RepID=UPI002715EE79|nr:sugar phosphate nucleotidyltransferase [Candidatus Binatus sp.]MDO8432749.1 sugar phosphate nucleotidyltransferase [Candidatus Binatus sp.]